MLDDILISYLGVSIKVTHSLYKPNPSQPGRIRYTFHLPTKKVTIEQLLDLNDRFYWVEVGKGKTPFAYELAKAMENHFKDEVEVAETNILKDIKIDYQGRVIRVSHSMMPQGKNDTGKIVYTFHLEPGPLTIRQYKDGKEFLWKEVPGGDTPLANTLGHLLEQYYGVTDK